MALDIRPEKRRKAVNSISFRKGFFSPTKLFEITAAGDLVFIPSVQVDEIDKDCIRADREKNPFPTWNFPNSTLLLESQLPREVFFYLLLFRLKSKDTKHGEYKPVELLPG